MYLLALFTGLYVFVDIVILPWPKIPAGDFVPGFVPSKVAPTSRIVMEGLQNLLLFVFIAYPLSFNYSSSIVSLDLRAVDRTRRHP